MSREGVTNGMALGTVEGAQGASQSLPFSLNERKNSFIMGKGDASFPASRSFADRFGGRWQCSLNCGLPNDLDDSKETNVDRTKLGDSNLLAHLLYWHHCSQGVTDSLKSIRRSGYLSSGNPGFRSPSGCPQNQQVSILPSLCSGPAGRCWRRILGRRRAIGLSVQSGQSAAWGAFNAETLWFGPLRLVAEKNRKLKRVEMKGGYHEESLTPHQKMSWHQPKTFSAALS